MAYASPMKIANGLVLDFTVDNAVTATDAFLGLNALGEVTQFASVPRARVSGGGNITESTSAVLTITGGTGAALTSALTIQVLQAGVAQSGYLSTTDWNTFNNKLSSSLTSAFFYVGNGSGVATGVAMSGDISITNAGVAAIAAGVIIDADVNAGAAIAFSKMAALTANRIVASNGSGVVSILDTATYPSLTELSYVKGGTSTFQTQIDSKLSVTLAGVTSGDVISYNGAAWVNTPSSGTGIPTAGTTNQILRKIDNTNYNAEWHTLVAADLTDVSSSAAELNKLTGVTTTATQFNFSNTLVGDIQSQLGGKLSSSLTTNSMWIGVGGVAGELAAGPNGYVLTSVSGLPTWTSPGVGGTVTSVAGSGGTTGMSFTGSPVTVSGTLTLTGTLIAANGGTGFASYAVGDILYANTTTTLAKLADVAVGSYLRSGGVSTAPVWSTTTLPNSATVGDILYASASNVYSNLGAGTVNYILTSNGAGVAPSWQAAAAGFADPMTTRGDIIIRNSSNVTARLGIGANTYVLTSDGTDITWQPSSGGSGFWSTVTGGTATGTNTFAMGSNPFIITTGVTTGTGATAGHQIVGNSLTTGNLFDVSSSSVSSGALGVFTSTSTVIDHTAGTNGLVEVLMSGANSTASKTAIGFYSKVTNTGTTSTNIAGYFEASGGTTNLALRTLGNVFIANASGDTPTVSTRLDVRGTGNTTNSTLRLADSGNTTTLLHRDDGLFRVTSNGATTNYIELTPGTASFITFNNPTGSASIGVQSGAANFAWVNKGFYVGGTLTFSNQISTDTNAPTILRTTGSTGLSGTTYTGRLGTTTGTSGHTFTSIQSEATSGTNTIVTLNSTYTASANLNHYTMLNIVPTYNITGSTRNIYGINYEPTLTSMTGVTHKAFRSTSGDWEMGGSATTLTLGGGATASELRFLEPSGGGSSYVGFKAPALAGNTVYDLPNAFPAVSGYVLSSTDAGVMSWVASGSGITNTAIADELMKSNGTNAVPSGLFSSAAGNLALGSASIAGNRTLSVSSSTASANLSITSQGASGIVSIGDQITGLGVILQSPGGLSLNVDGTNIYASIGTAATNTVLDVFSLVRTTSGTAANGIGARLTFQVENSANSTGVRSSIESIATDVTSTSEDFDLMFRSVAGGTLSERFRIVGDGRLYGTALHNNAGAVTGTTNQYIASGTYTPTLTNTTNIGASTAYLCQWTRVGNVVTVSGKIDIDITTTLLASDLGVSLPIASAFTNERDCGGIATSDSEQTANIRIKADATNDRAQFVWTGQAGTGNLSYSFTFTYLIL